MELRAITFDCYGTLIDWEAGLRAYVAPILAATSHHGVTVEQWIERWEKIQFQMLTPYRPYREIMQRSYDATMQHFGVEAFVDAGAGLARSVADWPPFADSRRALRRLARRHQLAIVSNIDRDLLADSVGQLQAPFSCLVTAEDARAYKPNPKPLALAIERLGVEPGAILHAAFGWKYDLAPARALGMRTCFVNRGGVRAEETSDFEVASLAALADTLGA
ncbi:MAG: haloacid dehalogenase, type [Myxococcales bacterium]|nr:haloacid dehalogenase, type [Myxococcales bacterium]